MPSMPVIYFEKTVKIEKNEAVRFFSSIFGAHAPFFDRKNQTAKNEKFKQTVGAGGAVARSGVDSSCCRGILKKLKIGEKIK